MRQAIPRGMPTRYFMEIIIIIIIIIIVVVIIITIIITITIIIFSPRNSFT